MFNRTPPTGVIVISFLGILGGLWGIVTGFGVATYSPFGTLLGPVLILLSVGHVLVCVGLLSLNSVAWVLAMILYGLSFLLDLLTLDVIGLLFSGLILAYLYSKRGMYMGNERSVSRGLR